MRALVLALALAVAACGDSTPPTLPGEAAGDTKPARRGDTSPCGSTGDFDGDGVIDYQFTYYYDDLGRSLQDVGRGLNENPDELDTYTWDNVDHMMSYVQLIGGREIYRVESTYDTLGNELDSTTTDSYDPQAILVSRTVNHEFDDHGRPAYAIQSSTGLPDLKSTYVYDDVGRLIERRDDESLDGTLDGTAYVVYDEDARVTTTTTTRRDGSHALRTRTYNESLHLITSRNQSYATDGRMTSSEIAITWDGDRELTWTYSYNGAVSSRYAFSYACPRLAHRTRSLAVSD